MSREGLYKALSEDGNPSYATIVKVVDYPTIVGYGVMSTPGLVVDEQVVLSGRVPTVAQVRELLAAVQP